MSPCQAVDDFLFFSPEILDLLRPKYPQKYKNNISGEKKHIRQRFGRGS